jgi:peroxiredoxin
VPVTRRTRTQVVVLLAVVAFAVGAVVFNSTVADDGDDVVRLDAPGEYVDPAVSNPPNDGDAFPAVELTATDGSTARLAVEGRPMVVNLWYSTCPPCARELTYFANVAAEVGDEVRFVGVNPLDDAGTMREFADERGVDYELFSDPDGQLESALGVVQYPVTLFVAPDGTIVDQVGALSEADLRERVGALIT